MYTTKLYHYTAPISIAILCRSFEVSGCWHTPKLDLAAKLEPPFGNHRLQTLEKIPKSVPASPRGYPQKSGCSQECSQECSREVHSVVKKKNTLESTLGGLLGISLIWALWLADRSSTLNDHEGLPIVVTRFADQKKIQGMNLLKVTVTVSKKRNIWFISLRVTVPSLRSESPGLHKCFLLQSCCFRFQKNSLCPN